MLEFILAVLIGCGRVNSAILSNSSASTSPELEWWRTLPRALIPNGPLTRTDLPTVLLVDQHPPPTIKPQPLTGREGALIYLYQNPFTTLTDPSLASKCGAQWSAESSEYIQSGRITTYSGQPARYADQWNYIPKSPCCGQCSIDGMSAELRYWPTPAPTPAVTAIVDNSGFTYLSPSVYVVFKSLGAYDACSQVGKLYQSQTFSFASAELSTSRGVHDEFGILHYPYSYAWTAFNYADITNSSCTELVAYSIEEEHYTNTKGVTITAEANTFYYNPCFPFLSLPSQVLSLDPAWSTCVHGLGAFYDPPRVLKSVDHLLAPVQVSTTVGSHDPVQTGGATAGQAIPLPTIAITTMAPSMPSPTPPADPKPADLGLENLQSQNAQPDPILTAAQDPQVPPIPKNSLTSILQPLPKDDPKIRPHPSEGVPNTENNQSNNIDLQSPTPDAPLIYISGEKIVEGAPPTSIGGKAIVYTFGSLHVGDKIQPVPTAIPQAYPATSIKVDGLHVEIKPAPSPSRRPNNADSPLIYISGEKVVEGAPPTSIGGKVIVYTSGSLHVGDKIQPVPTAISQAYPFNVDGLHVEIKPAPSPSGRPNKADSPIIYISGEKVVEGAPPTSIGGKVIVYTSGSLHVGDKIQPVPTAISQAYPINVDGLHVEIKPAASPLGRPNNADSQTPTITSGPFSIVAQQNYHVVLDGQTIIAGGSAQTISGTRISLATSATAIIVGEHSIQIPNVTNLPPNATPTIALTLGSSAYTIPLSSNLVIGTSKSQFAATPKPFIVLQGQTLLAGGDAKMISGTMVSLMPSATAILVAGTVIPISKSTPGAAVVLNLGSSKYTATISTDPFISGIAQTLFPGSLITMGGRPISLDASGRGKQGLGAVILGEFKNNGLDTAHENTPVAVVLVGTRKQTITPTPVLVDGRTVYIYPSGAILMSDDGSTILNTGSGLLPFPRVVTTGGAPPNASNIGVEFYTGSTSSLRLTTFGGWLYWEKIIVMALAISLSIIIAY